MKDNDDDPQEPDVSNPYHLLLLQLTGTSSKPPRFNPASNIWRKDHRDEIETELSHRAKTEGRSRKTLAALRERVARELFGNLSQAEKNEWAEEAKQQHEAASSEWKKEISAPPSTRPADRER